MSNLKNLAELGKGDEDENGELSVPTSVVKILSAAGTSFLR